MVLLIKNLIFNFLISSNHRHIQIWLEAPIDTVTILSVNFLVGLLSKVDAGNIELFMQLFTKFSVNNPSLVSKCLHYYFHIDPWIYIFKYIFNIFRWNVFFSFGNI